jgi:signal transduction histidine kinase
MSLAGRFSALFLAALGVVLVGFSTALYVSARIYLDRQVADRLSSALAVLAAAAEIHPEGVEWEPQERVLPLGQEPGADRLRWAVLDEQGRRIDHSRNLVDAELTAAWVPKPGMASLPGRVVDRRGRPWRIARRRLSSNDLAGQRLTIEVLVHRSADAGNRRDPADPVPPERLYPALILTVVAPLGPMESTLAALACCLAAISAATWLMGALLCRRLTRRALAPLTRMAASAHGLDAKDSGWSLEQAGTGDELENLGRAFNDLLARLHVAFERQRRFSGDASHQLRTPLTVLIGQIEVALRQERSGEEYRRVLGSALGRALELRQIVEALLFLARADGEAQLPRGERLELGHWVDEYLANRPANGRRTEIAHRRGQGSDLLILVHPPLLGQLLENLLDNAEKYGRPGEPVVVETVRANGSGVLAVQNSGPGILADELPHVSEPFYRSSQARRLGAPGVGLGLTVVQRIAEAFGGSLDIQSQAGTGCRVEVKFPLNQSHCPPASPPAPVS